MFINLFGGTVFLATILFILFLYKSIKIESEKVKNEKVKDTFDGVVDIAFRAVMKLMQTTVSRLKEKDKWDEVSAKDVFNQALQETKYQLGQEGLELLKEKVTDVDGYLTSLIESIVYETKTPEGVNVNEIIELAKKKSIE